MMKFMLMSVVFVLGFLTVGFQSKASESTQTIACDEGNLVAFRTISLTPGGRETLARHLFVAGLPDVAKSDDRISRWLNLGGVLEIPVRFNSVGDVIFSTFPEDEDDVFFQLKKLANTIDKNLAFQFEIWEIVNGRSQRFSFIKFEDCDFKEPF